MKEKLGFLHVPRTGGAYLQKFFTHFSAHQYVNFFGQPGVLQKDNKCLTVHSLGYDSITETHIRENPNFETCHLFSGHFSGKIKDVFREYDIKLFTILRDPVNRSLSLIRRIMEGNILFNEYLLSHGATFGDEVFFQNLKRHFSIPSKDGITMGGGHTTIFEHNSFFNYATKALSGVSLIDPDLRVEDWMLEKAKEELDQMVYVGYFEEYEDAFKFILELLEIPLGDYEVKPPTIYEISEENRRYLTGLNWFDIELYEYSKNRK